MAGASRKFPETDTERMKLSSYSMGTLFFAVLLVWLGLRIAGR
jgi:hypothetical protein